MADYLHDPPPDAPPPRGTGADGQSGTAAARQAQSTGHDPAMCATCQGGVRPWTPERREAAASYAATSGRRIDHLPEVARV